MGIKKYFKTPFSLYRKVSAKVNGEYRDTEQLIQESKGSLDETGGNYSLDSDKTTLQYTGIMYTFADVDAKIDDIMIIGGVHYRVVFPRNPQTRNHHKEILITVVI